MYRIAHGLTESRFYISLHRKQVISEMLFPANLLASTDKTKIIKQKKPQIYNKPRLREHASETQKYYNKK